jgi:hypothetical protein
LVKILLLFVITEESFCYYEDGWRRGFGGAFMEGQAF